MPTTAKTAKAPAALTSLPEFPGTVWSPTPISAPLPLEWASYPGEVYLGMTAEGTLVAAVVTPSGRVEGIESGYTATWAGSRSEGYDETESENADDI